MVYGSVGPFGSRQSRAERGKNSCHFRVVGGGGAGMLIHTQSALRQETSFRNEIRVVAKIRFMMAKPKNSSCKSIF